MKNVDNKVKKEDVSIYNDIFCMSTKPDTLQADFISFYVHLNGSFLDFYVENAIPVYIDYPKTRIIVNDTVYRLNAFGVDEFGIKYYESVEKRDEIPHEQDLIGSILLPDDYYYDLYKQYNKSNYQPIDYKIDNKNIEIPTIHFSEETTPLSIRAEVVYYTDSVCNDMNMAEITLYQSDLLKKTDVREEKHKQKIYKLGTSIAREVSNVSFYTYNKTGTIWGWPEVKIGLAKVGAVSLATIVAVLYVVAEVELYDE